MLNGLSVSTLMMLVGGLLIAIALWRIKRIFYPSRRTEPAHEATATPQDARRGE